MKSVLLETTVPAEVAARRPRSLPRFVWPVRSDRWPLVQKVLRDRAAVVGVLIIMGLLCTAALAPYLAPFPEDVSATHPAQRLQAPSWTHPFGTDTLGRDIYSRLLFGGRITLVIALTV